MSRECLKSSIPWLKLSSTLEYNLLELRMGRNISTLSLADTLKKGHYPPIHMLWHSIKKWYSWEKKPSFTWGGYIHNVHYRGPKIFMGWGCSHDILINRMLTRVLKFATPLNRLLDIFPHIFIFTSLPLKIFGCTLFVLIHKQNCSKTWSSVRKVCLLGILQHRKGTNVIILFQRNLLWL